MCQSELYANWVQNTTVEYHCHCFGCTFSVWVQCKIFSVVDPIWICFISQLFEPHSMAQVSHFCIRYLDTRINSIAFENAICNDDDRFHDSIDKGCNRHRVLKKPIRTEFNISFAKFSASPKNRKHWSWKIRKLWNAMWDHCAYLFGIKSFLKWWKLCWNSDNICCSWPSEVSLCIPVAPCMFAHYNGSYMFSWKL